MYKTRVTRLTVIKDNEPLFSEYCTHLSIEDEAAGEYVAIKQQHNVSGVEADQCIALESRKEWEQVKQAVEQLFAEIEGNERNTITTQRHDH